MLSTLYRRCVRTTTVQFPSPILKMLPSPSNVKINNAYPKNEGVSPTPLRSFRSPRLRYIFRRFLRDHRFNNTALLHPQPPNPLLKFPRISPIRKQIIQLSSAPREQNDKPHHNSTPLSQDNTKTTESNKSPRDQKTRNLLFHQGYRRRG